jgi:DnaK suppressor protein
MVIVQEVDYRDNAEPANPTRITMAKKTTHQGLREVLIKRRDALRQALAGDLSLLQQLRRESGDLIDAAIDTSYEDVSSQMVEVESRELVFIQQALARMDAGTYGRCESCNCLIAVARLQVLPYATMCIKCQRQAENSGEGRGRSTDWSKLVDASPRDEVRLNDIDFNASQ